MVALSGQMHWNLRRQQETEEKTLNLRSMGRKASGKRLMESLDLNLGLSTI